MAAFTPDRTPNGTKHTAFGAFRARSVVAISSTPTFSTGWGVLGSLGIERAGTHSSGSWVRLSQLMRLACSGYFCGAGQSSGAGGLSIGTRGRCSSAVSLSPACSLVAQSPAGMKSWMNANAGAVITTNMSAATKAAANTIFTLLKMATSLRVFSSPDPYNLVYVPSARTDFEAIDTKRARLSYRLVVLSSCPYSPK